MIYCYSGSSANIWWKQNVNKFQRFGNLLVYNILPEAVKELAQLAQRHMQLHCNIQENICSLGDRKVTIEITPDLLK
jgi:uncharacterized protein YaeQ